MTWIDWTIAAVLLFSVLVGLRRGTIVSAVSAVGVIVGYIGASYWYRQLADVIGPPVHLSPDWAGTAAFTILLLVIYEAIGIAATLLGSSARLSPGSRLIGAAFGAIKGALLAMALLTVAAASPSGEPIRRDAERSTLAPYAQKAQHIGMEALASVLPEKLRPFGVNESRF